MTQKSPKPQITEQLVDYVEDFLGNAGINYFQQLRDQYGYIPLVVEVHDDDGSTFPHPIHFHEGMQIRNSMRDSGLVEDWDAHQLDDYWIEVVGMVLNRQKD